MNIMAYDQHVREIDLPELICGLFDDESPRMVAMFFREVSEGLADLLARLDNPETLTSRESALFAEGWGPESEWRQCLLSVLDQAWAMAKGPEWVKVRQLVQSLRHMDIQMIDSLVERNVQLGHADHMAPWLYSAAA